MAWERREAIAEVSRCAGGAVEDEAEAEAEALVSGAIVGEERSWKFWICERGTMR
jgi:hypothetical protein